MDIPTDIVYAQSHCLHAIPVTALVRCDGSQTNTSGATLADGRTGGWKDTVK